MYNLFLLDVHWCSACIYVGVRVPDALGLELQTAVRRHTAGPLQEQPIFLTTEPSLEPTGEHFQTRHASQSFGNINRPYLQWCSVRFTYL